MWLLDGNAWTNKLTNLKTLLLALVVIPLLSGCFWEADVQQLAQNQTIIYTGAVSISPNSERLLELDFRSSDVPWDPERVLRIARARSAINGMTEYVQDRLNFDSSITYYTYKVWFEFTAYQYMKLQSELDARVKIPGAISEAGAELYWYAKRDVLNMLEQQRIKIAATEKAIDDRASADTLNDIKNMYDTMKPLVGMLGII